MNRTLSISRRSFLAALGLGTASALLAGCAGPAGSSASSGSASSQADAPAVEPFLTPEEFPGVDGSTACVPLIAQIIADTTGTPLTEAQSAVNVSTTAYAWENMGVYDSEAVQLLIVYEAPDYVKKEISEAGTQLDQKAIGRDALVFIVNEDNPVQSLTLDQLRDIYAGRITNWKATMGEDSGSQTLFRNLLIGDGDLMAAPTELAPASMGGLVDSIASYNNSANAIGFSVYYYIDQMYSQPGLRLLSVEDVTPSYDTIASQEYPLCNDFYAVVRSSDTAGTPQRQVYDWLSTEEGVQCVKKAGYVPLLF